MNIVPPPWTLTGRGCILVYRFPHAWALRHGNIPPSRASSFLGGVGAVMLVDYAESDCGPYRELLFVPGKFRGRDGKSRYSITKIFVSTQVSVDSGVKNWGIPKELAAFEWTRDGNAEHVRVVQGDMPVAEFKLSSSIASMQLTTSFVPEAWRTLEQTGVNGETLLTTLDGDGWMSLAKLEDVTVNPALFPDLNEFKPLVVTKAEAFTLRFPVPRRV